MVIKSRPAKSIASDLHIGRGPAQSNQHTRISRQKGRKKKSILPVIVVALPLACLLAVTRHAWVTIATPASSPITPLSSSTATTTLQYPVKINTNLLQKQWKHGNDGVWMALLEEGSALQQQQQTNERVHVMEVGMHDVKHCARAARKNLLVHCIEPSPSSLDRILSGFERQSESAKTNIRFYQMAAGPTTGLDLPFLHDGGTGDHVDLKHSNENATIVKSVAIDDIIDQKIKPTIDYSTTSATTTSATSDQGKTEMDGGDRALDRLFLLKVDTQGFEPLVFSGLKKSLMNRKIDHVFTEFWPKGIDKMEDEHGQECAKPVELLKLLVQNGYTLYALKNLSHPSADDGAKRNINAFHRPDYFHDYNDLYGFCKFYYDMERRFPDKIGYWTDVLAVSPNARYTETPQTEIGTILKNGLKG